METVELIAKWFLTIVLLGAMFFLSVNDKAVFGFSAGTLLILFVLHGVQYFQFGKDGITLRKTINEAKGVIRHLRKLALAITLPVMEIMPRLGIVDAQFSIEEMLVHREMLLENLKGLGVDKKLRKQMVRLDNAMLNSICYLIISPINGTPYVKYLKELMACYFYDGCLDDPDYNPDINKIKNKIEELGLNNLLDHDGKYLFFEAEYFKKHKSIRNLKKMRKAINTRTHGSYKPSN